MDLSCLRNFSMFRTAVLAACCIIATASASMLCTSSTGTFASVSAAETAGIPCAASNGETCSRVCVVVFHVCSHSLAYSCQFSYCCFDVVRRHRAMNCHILSMVALPVGWCANVVVCLQPITLQILLVAFATNSLALSLCMLIGHPFSKNILSIRHCATVAAFLSLVGHRVISDVAKSMIPNMYLYPALLSVIA